MSISSVVTFQNTSARIRELPHQIDHPGQWTAFQRRKRLARSKVLVSVDGSNSQLHVLLATNGKLIPKALTAQLNSKRQVVIAPSVVVP